MFPNEKKFAFTIIDDTDNSTYESNKVIYDFLNDLGIKTTKTVWVYDPRDDFTGISMQNDDYVKFLNNLQSNGFEIALHNVGSGAFERSEIIQGLEMFRNKLGHYPKMHINHASNPDNIYWGGDRFSFPLKQLINLLYGEKRKYHGTNSKSKFFWGDYHKKYIKYTRNLVFNSINTIKSDKKMPYKIKEKEEYSNYWFSSSDAHTAEEFIDLIRDKNIKKLEKQSGVCIIYTHFASGFLDDNGDLNTTFKHQMEKLANNSNGWFVNASTILDFLKSKHKDAIPSKSYLFTIEIKWMIHRIIKKIKYKR